VDIGGLTNAGPLAKAATDKSPVDKLDNEPRPVVETSEKQIASIS